MFYANGDGAGWAYAKDGKIYFSKGYTNMNKFIKAVQKLPLDVERMVHCRIATHGGVSKPLTHPFPISRDYAKMEMLNGVLSHGYILAHNGILSNFTPPSNHSDTEELVRCLANCKSDIMDEGMRDIINMLISGSRVAILNTDGKINRYGTGWTQIDGIWFSNTHFKYHTLRYYDDAWDEWDEWYGRAYKNYKSVTSTSEKKESKSSSDSLPSADALVELPEGEVVKVLETKVAYMNKTEGSYMVDYSNGKMYGMYKGSIVPTKYEVCMHWNCAECDYKCPYKD
jgi:predicted glutamine amidotransferase